MKKIIASLMVAAFTAAPVFAADLGGRVLNIGSDTTYPPHEFIEDGVVKGFDVDVVAAICERINCKPNWVSTAWDGIFPALADGQFDMVVLSLIHISEPTRQAEISYAVFCLKSWGDYSPVSALKSVTCAASQSIF